MYRAALPVLPPFDRLPVWDGPAPRPVGDGYTAVVYEADDPAVVRDLLTDPALVPAGLCRGPTGGVRAVFWQVRGRAGRPVAG